jgi:DNA modification methylase
VEHENTILLGDALDRLKQIADNSVDLCVTDPPYGIGFMGKAWDTFSPDYIAKKKLTRQEFGGSDATIAGKYDYSKSGRLAFQDFIYEHGKEILRVLKPGAFMFMSMTPRQDCLSRVYLALEDAGFNTNFTSKGEPVSTG